MFSYYAYVLRKPLKKLSKVIWCVFFVAVPWAKTELGILAEAGGSVNIQGLMKSAIDIDVTAYSSELFICSPKCYKRLLRFERLSKNCISLKEEIKRDFEKGGLRTKRLRKDSTSQVSLASGPIQSTTTTQQPTESARSGAAKSLKFPRATTYTSYGQDTINQQVAGFSFLDLPPPPSLFLTSTLVSKGIKLQMFALIHIQRNVWYFKLSHKQMML